MVDVIRNWLLGIVKQAIEETSPKVIKIDRPDGMVSVFPSDGGLPTHIEEPRTLKRAVPRFGSNLLDPLSFEQMQDESLQRQNDYWAKNGASDS